MNPSLQKLLGVRTHVLRKTGRSEAVFAVLIAVACIGFAGWVNWVIEARLEPTMRSSREMDSKIESRVVNQQLAALLRDASAARADLDGALVRLLRCGLWCLVGMALLLLHSAAAWWRAYELAAEVISLTTNDDTEKVTLVAEQTTEI